MPSNSRKCLSSIHADWNQTFSKPGEATAKSHTQWIVSSDRVFINTLDKGNDGLLNIFSTWLKQPRATVGQNCRPEEEWTQHATTFSAPACWFKQLQQYNHANVCVNSWAVLHLQRQWYELPTEKTYLGPDVSKIHIFVWKLFYICKLS